MTGTAASLTISPPFSRSRSGGRCSGASVERHSRYAPAYSSTGDGAARWRLSVNVFPRVLPPRIKPPLGLVPVGWAATPHTSLIACFCAAHAFNQPRRRPTVCAAAVDAIRHQPIHNRRHCRRPHAMTATARERSDPERTRQTEDGHGLTAPSADTCDMASRLLANSRLPERAMGARRVPGPRWQLRLPALGMLAGQSALYQHRAARGSGLLVGLVVSRTRDRCHQLAEAPDHSAASLA